MRGVGGGGREGEGWRANVRPLVLGGPVQTGCWNHWCRGGRGGGRLWIEGGVSVERRDVGQLFLLGEPGGSKGVRVPPSQTTVQH